MKKIAILAAVTFLLFTSCQTGAVIWDDSHPSEKLAAVQFLGMKITGFNGIDVDKFNWVKIPAGEATMSGDVTITHGGMYFQARNMEFTCMFEEGKEYRVSGGVNNMRWGVNVYENGEFKAFVPFIEQPKFT